MKQTGTGISTGEHTIFPVRVLWKNYIRHAAFLK